MSGTKKLKKWSSFRGARPTDDLSRIYGSQEIQQRYRKPSVHQQNKRNRRSRSVSPVMTELRQRLAQHFITLSYNNVNNVQADEEEVVKVQLRSIKPGIVSEQTRRFKSLRPFSHQQSRGPVALPKVIKDGAVDRVKVTHSGSLKSPKHWSTEMYALLTDHAVFFAEDRDAFLAMKSGCAAVCRDKVDLRGAKLFKDTEHVHSTKKNVLAIVGRDGTVALMQNEESLVSDGWFTKMADVIRQHSNTHMAPVSFATKSALSRFFKKRPLKETLVNQGIYKNEPIFGNNLDRLYDGDGAGAVPAFVKRCTEILENPPHVFSIGLYRTSGNLSHIQKLRLRVDQEDAKALEDCSVISDSDVLAGALKLFFRELHSPLIPYKSYSQLSEACGLPERQKQVRAVKETLDKLSEAHRKTLACLCTHLLRVTRYETQNQMSAANLGIVWGPSITWPDVNAGPKALMHQCTDVNRVVQYLIEESALLFQ